MTSCAATRASASLESLERAREDLGFFPDLLVEIADLRAQFLDAGMVAEKRGGLLGKLRTQGDALLGQLAPFQECVRLRSLNRYV